MIDTSESQAAEIDLCYAPIDRRKNPEEDIRVRPSDRMLGQNRIFVVETFVIAVS